MEEQILEMTIRLSREEAELKSGRQIPLEEWHSFWKCFKEYYLLEHDATLQWIGEEWDELKHDY